MSRIRLLSRRAIDDQAWDVLVRQFGRGLPYAYSWYLDIMTGARWSALVEGDYKRILPLPWNSKLLGLRQIYQPALSQQYGVFGTQVQPADTERFLAAIPSSFLRVQLMLHAQQENDLPGILKGSIRWKTNLVLPLDQDFESIEANFSKSLRKRYRKAARQLRLQAGGSIETLVHFYRQELQHKAGLSAKQYARAARLFAALLARDMAETYQVYDQEGQLVCTGLFVKTDGRIINLFGASDQRGRETYAMHFLLVQVIQKHAGQDLLFDFEGSEVPGVAQFFRSFGPIEQPFYAYLNELL